MKTLTGLTTEEARAACDAVAKLRLRQRCECEPDVGYVCRFCQRMEMESAGYEWTDLVGTLADWIYAMHVKEGL